MRIKSIQACAIGCFVTAAICYIVHILRLETNYHPSGSRFVEQVSISGERAEQQRQLIATLPRINVSLFNSCDPYNELRDVNFFDTSMKDRLCAGAPAYTVVEGRFPPCQLSDDLPSPIYATVRRTAKLATVKKALHKKRMLVYTFGEQDLISRDILKYHTWEPLHIGQMLRILKRFSTNSVTFLDIGSNLGLYSLQAREEGFPVVAVDANIRTLIRVQMTARLLGILDDRLKLIWCFLDEQVALKRLNWVALTDSCHVGGASSGSTGWVRSNSTEDTIPVMTARADDLLPFIKTKKVVIKMDIESGEHMLFRTGARLFSELDVLVLQMEFWRVPGTSPQTSPFYNFVTDFMTTRNFTLISVLSRRVQNISTFNEWDGMWVRNDYLRHFAKL